VTFWFGSGSAPLAYRSVSGFGSGSGSCSGSGSAFLSPVLWICDILVWIRIFRSVPLTYGSVSKHEIFLFFSIFVNYFCLPGSGSRIQDPESESGIRIRNPNPESESESGIRIRNPNPESESGSRSTDLIECGSETLFFWGVIIILAKKF